MAVTTASPAETVALGERIGAVLRPGTIVSLVGELGAGKTWLSKGMVHAINGYEVDEVTSPAFSLVNEYRAVSGIPVFHMDFYRLDDLDEADWGMFEEYFSHDHGISLVEWGDKFLPRFAVDYVEVGLRVGDAAEGERVLDVRVPDADGVLDGLLGAR